MNLKENDPLTILWRVDEIQQIDLQLNHYFQKLMGHVLERAGTSTFIIPIYSGTSDIHLKESTYMYYVQSIQLYLSDISVDIALKLMNNELKLQIQDEIKDIKKYIIH